MCYYVPNQQRRHASTEARSEHVRVAHALFLRAWSRFARSVGAHRQKISASELRRKFINECVAWLGAPGPPSSVLNHVIRKCIASSSSSISLVTVPMFISALSTVTRGGGGQRRQGKSSAVDAGVPNPPSHTPPVTIKFQESVSRRHQELLCCGAHAGGARNAGVGNPCISCALPGSASRLSKSNCPCWPPLLCHG